MHEAKVKLYANEDALIVKDEKLIQTYLSLQTMEGIFGTTEDFRKAYHAFCNEIRDILDLSVVISFHHAEQHQMLYVILYDQFVTPGSEPDRGIDDAGPFIWVAA